MLTAHNKNILFIFLILFTVMISSSLHANPCEEKEVIRRSSPDELVDHVVIEKDCGATTSITILIFIVPKGQSTEEGNPVFRADHVDGLKVDWSAAKETTITYKSARIFTFTNFWHSREIKNWNYIVTIKEHQDESAGSIPWYSYRQPIPEK